MIELKDNQRQEVAKRIAEALEREGAKDIAELKGLGIIEQAVADGISVQDGPYIPRNDPSVAVYLEELSHADSQLSKDVAKAREEISRSDVGKNKEEESESFKNQEEIEEDREKYMEKNSDQYEKDMKAVLGNQRNVTNTEYQWWLDELNRVPEIYYQVSFDDKNTEFKVEIIVKATKESSPDVLRYVDAKDSNTWAIIDNVEAAKAEWKSNDVHGMTPSIDNQEENANKDMTDINKDGYAQVAKVLSDLGYAKSEGKQPTTIKQPIEADRRDALKDILYYLRNQKGIRQELEKA